MTNWEIYVKESYDLIRRAECELTVNLPHQIEAYLVHLFANFMDKPKVNTEPIGVKLIESINKPGPIKKEILQKVGDECLLIHSMEWGRRSWPVEHYYHDLGQSAYSSRAFITRPPDELFDNLAMMFDLSSRVLRHCKLS